MAEEAEEVASPAMSDPSWVMVILEVSFLDPCAKEPTQWKFAFTFMNNWYKQNNFRLGFPRLNLLPFNRD